jgi:hypothetical protein
MASSTSRTEYKLTKAAMPGRVIMARFGTFETVVSSRRPDGKVEHKRLEKLRPDFDACPSGVSIREIQYPGRNCELPRECAPPPPLSRCR